MQEAKQDTSLVSTLSLNWPYAFARGNAFSSKNPNGKRATLQRQANASVFVGEPAQALIILHFVRRRRRLSKEKKSRERRRERSPPYSPLSSPFCDFTAAVLHVARNFRLVFSIKFHLNIIISVLRSSELFIIND